jgi:hypothetical protein
MAKETKVKKTTSKRKSLSGAPRRTKTLTSNQATGVYTKTKKKIGKKKVVTKTFKADTSPRGKTTKTKTVRTFKFGSSARPIGGGGGRHLGKKRKAEHTESDKKKVTTYRKTPTKTIKKIIKKTTPKKRRTVYSRK